MKNLLLLIIILTLFSCEKQNPNDWCDNYMEKYFTEGEFIYDTSLYIKSGNTKVEYHCDNTIDIISLTDTSVLLGEETITINGKGNRIRIIKKAKNYIIL